MKSGFAAVIALMTLGFSLVVSTLLGQNNPAIQYTLSAPRAATHYFHVDLQISGWASDSLDLKMPQWMPGYYQLMGYAKSVENIGVGEGKGKRASLKQVNENTWRLSNAKSTTIIIRYDIKAEKQFVANSYADERHGYAVLAGLLLYVEGHLNMPVNVKIIGNKQWTTATGLTPVPGKSGEFTAPDFDILYDCPVLFGELEELPSFNVNGVEHRFIGFDLGKFDRNLFMTNLKKVVEASAAVIGDIPFKQYTFIAIGPTARGGIEHLNNTTFGFDGNSVNTTDGMNRMLNFLAHEYFHHYNVKRIRPLELGPFDYEKGSKTNLLWVSEGISVYYEYLIVKRAGLVTEQGLYGDFEGNINAHENNPGRAFQSLVQASYDTWSDGPFGTAGKAPGRAISYYDKGPIFGLLLDFAIRHHTQNTKSLDDVMRWLYFRYYKELGRGFTDAEFQQSCETIAGASLNDLFEYVYTTKDIDYDSYLGYAGLKMKLENDPANVKRPRKFTIEKLSAPGDLEVNILKSWLGEK